MLFYKCDKCGSDILTDGYRFHMSYSGGNEVDLCKKCVGEFKSWIYAGPEPKSKMDPTTYTGRDVVRCTECVYSQLTVSGECKYCTKWEDEFECSTELYLSKGFYCAFGERSGDKQ